jgi:hypothetical protein
MSNMRAIVLQKKNQLRAGPHSVGFSSTSFFSAFSINLKDSHRIDVTVVFRQKIDR